MGALLLFLALSSRSAFADPVGPDEGFRHAFFYGAFMLANYVANCVVLGVPAWRFAGVAPGRVAKDLIVYTLLGQVADLVGLFAGILLSWPFHRMGVRGPLFDIISHICIFIGSGLAIACLVRFYLKNRWQLSDRLNRGMMIGAAILTNPIIGVAFIPKDL